jgi:hypothetical protein
MAFDKIEQPALAYCTGKYPIFSKTGANFVEIMARAQLALASDIKCIGQVAPQIILFLYLLLRETYRKGAYR